MSERDLDARFLIPIIAEMDKVQRPVIYNPETYLRSGELTEVLGGYHEALAANCFYSERATRAQKLGSLGIQFHRDDTASDVWERHFKPTPSASE